MYIEIANRKNNASAIVYAAKLLCHDIHVIEMEAYPKQMNLRYLLGVLNSKYAHVLLSNLRGGDYHIYPEHLRNLPIPDVSEKQQQPIIELVKQILEAKGRGEETAELEARIDKAVYGVYGLGEGEG